MYKQYLKKKISTRFQVFFTEKEKISKNVYKITNDKTSNRNTWLNDRVKPIFDKEKDNLVLINNVLYYRKPLELVPYIDYYEKNHERDVHEGLISIPIPDEEEFCPSTKDNHEELMKISIPDVPSIKYESYLDFLDDFGDEVQAPQSDEISCFSFIPVEIEENDVEDDDLLRDELNTLSSNLPEYETIDIEDENLDYLPVDELTTIDEDYRFAHYYEFLELISRNGQDFGEIESKLIQEMLSLNITKATESFYRQQLYDNPINIGKENLYQLREKLYL